MAIMCVRDFECTLCQQHFEMMYGDLIFLEELLCDECLKELWSLEDDELRERVSQKLAKNALWLEEHYKWHGERELEDGIVQCIQEHKQHGAGMDRVIQEGTDGF